MVNLNKSYASLLVLLFALSLFPLSMPTSFKIDEEKNPLFEKFPTEFAGWVGKEQAVDEKTYEILETRNVLSRLYENDKGEKVHLLMVGSHKDRRVAHPPEVCYLSSNYLIVDEAPETLSIDGKDVPVRTFVAKSERDPNYIEEVFYLYKVGNQFTTNYYAQQLQFAVDRLTKKESSVLLIRLAGPSRDVYETFLGDILKFID